MTGRPAWKLLALRIALVTKKRGGLGGTVALEAHVFGDGFGIAFCRIALTAAARRAHAHPIAGRESNILFLGEMFGDMGDAVPGDLNPVGPAIPATKHALRPGAAVIHHKAGARGAAQRDGRLRIHDFG